jgi:hypothetical protein
MNTLNINGFYLIETCESCPEQYEVFDNRLGLRVAYFRLRHGKFYAARTGPPIGNEDFQILERFYEAEPIGDGRFHDDERAQYLDEACCRLREIMEPPTPPHRTTNMLNDKLRIQSMGEHGVTLEIGFGSPDHSRSVKLTPEEARELCDTIVCGQQPLVDMGCTLANVEVSLSKAVYRATAILEKLERAGAIGKRHHILMCKQIVDKAILELYNRWFDADRSTATPSPEQNQ